MRHRRRAFTLVEILTITTIIALIAAAMLIPTLQSMRRRAKTVMCANNLKRLGQAIGTRRSDELQRRVGQLAPSRWQTDLAPYLPLDSNDLVCPEYDPGDDVPPVGQGFRFHLYTHAYPQTEY